MASTSLRVSVEQVRQMLTGRGALYADVVGDLTSYGGGGGGTDVVVSVTGDDVVQIVRDFGVGHGVGVADAVPDAVTVQVCGSINAASNTLTLSGAANVPSNLDIGKGISVQGAGAAGAPLITTITNVAGGGVTITLNNSASTKTTKANVCWGTDWTPIHQNALNVAPGAVAYAGSATGPQGNAIEFANGNYYYSGAVTTPRYGMSHVCPAGGGIPQGDGGSGALKSGGAFIITMFPGVLWQLGDPAQSTTQHSAPYFEGINWQDCSGSYVSTLCQLNAVTHWSFERCQWDGGLKGLDVQSASKDGSWGKIDHCQGRDCTTIYNFVEVGAVYYTGGDCQPFQGQVGFNSAGGLYKFLGGHKFDMGGVLQWATATAVTANPKTFVRPTTPNFNGFYYQCTVAGTTGGAEPAWPTLSSASATVVDGTATWQRIGGLSADQGAIGIRIIGGVNTQGGAMALIGPRCENHGDLAESDQKWIQVIAGTTTGSLGGIDIIGAHTQGGGGVTNPGTAIELVGNTSAKRIESVHIIGGRISAWATSLHAKNFVQATLITGGCSMSGNVTFDVNAKNNTVGECTLTGSGVSQLTDNDGSNRFRGPFTIPGSTIIQPAIAYSATPGAVATVAIPHLYPKAPLAVSVTPTGVNARGAPAFYVTKDATNITLNFASNLTAATVYSWDLVFEPG